MRNYLGQSSQQFHAEKQTDLYGCMPVSVIRCMSSDKGKKHKNMKVKDNIDVYVL